LSNFLYNGKRQFKDWTPYSVIKNSFLDCYLEQKSTTETQKKLTDNFKVFSGANGELSLTQFIKTLASMDEFKELANSPLVNRLFNVFDKVTNCSIDF